MGEVAKGLGVEGGRSQKLGLRLWRLDLGRARVEAGGSSGSPREKTWPNRGRSSMRGDEGLGSGTS